MQRLSEILGSLYFLQPLCGTQHEDWRAQATELINLDQPDPDRRERLIGAFNAGYHEYARLFVSCTGPARESLSRLLGEAQNTARDIHARYAE